MKGCTPLCMVCSEKLISTNPRLSLLTFCLLSSFSFLLFYVIPYSISQLRTELRHVGSQLSTLPMSQLSEDQTLSFIELPSTISTLPSFRSARCGSHLFFGGPGKLTMKPFPTSWCSFTRHFDIYFGKRSTIWSDSSGRQ